ncbi:MAG TPA: hypothetical protein VLT33_30455 [Labilithrix sp.]|nr:hypothetical protein [Labilithrix sp.]
MLLASGVDSRAVKVTRDASLGAALRAMPARSVVGSGLVILLAGGLIAIALARDDEPESLRPFLLCSLALSPIFVLVWLALRHLRTGLTRLAVTFAPDGIVEDRDGRKIPHPWSWLTHFRDEEQRLTFHLGTGAHKHRLILVKRPGHDVPRKLLQLFVDHAPSGAAWATKGTATAPTKKPATPATSTAPPPKPTVNPRDLN